jgi:excisionase family DNA binding protein
MSITDPFFPASLPSEIRAMLREELERHSLPRHEDVRLLTAREVAALLRVDERTLRRLVHEGAVPAPLHLGKRAIRWDRLALLRSLGLDPS